MCSLCLCHVYHSSSSYTSEKNLLTVDTENAWSGFFCLFLVQSSCTGFWLKEWCCGSTFVNIFNSCHLYQLLSPPPPDNRCRCCTFLSPTSYLANWDMALAENCYLPTSVPFHWSNWQFLANWQLLWSSEKESWLVFGRLNYASYMVWPCGCRVNISDKIQTSASSLQGLDFIFSS